MSGLPAVSTATFSGSLRAPIASIQRDLTTAQTELSTGRRADVGLFLGGRTADASTLHSVQTRLAAFTDANAAVSARLDATQTALDSVLDSAQSLQKGVIAATNGPTNTSDLTGVAQAALQTILSSLNTAAAGQNVFAGLNTDVRPFADDGAAGKQAVAAAFTATFGVAPGDPAASAITPAAMQTFLDGPFAQQFASPAWQANWSAASDTAVTARVSPTRIATASVSANDPDLRNVVQANAMLSELGLSSLSTDTRAVVLAQASKLLGQSTADIADMQSKVGTMQNTISTATDEVAHAKSFVETQIGALEDADPAEVSTRISTLTTQLESAYTLTNKLSQLSLVRFLT